MNPMKCVKLCALLLCLALLASACSVPAEPTVTDAPTEGDTTVTDPTIVTKPTDPAPTDPVPTDPTPTEPAPTDPAPTDPPPTDPAPTDPPPTDPPPTDPAPTDPPPTEPVDTYAVRPLKYPEEDVKTLRQRMISLNSFCARAAGSASYTGNRHYTGTHLVISPYFTATVDDVTLPVYATPVYIYESNSGALHSFASVDVDFGKHDHITLKLLVDDSVSVGTAAVFSHDPAVLTRSGKTVTLQVSKHGVYTVVLDDNQQYAVTIFVRTYADEDAEIAAYKAQYGESNVTVFEPGIHEIDHLIMTRKTVIYLKAGAILLPKHTIDIMDDDAAANQSEYGAVEANGIGLNRYPVITGHACNYLTIAGRGTVDMTQLDWHERRGIVFTQCNTVTMDGVILINPCEWAFITYRCNDVTVTQCAVLGYRTNSDAFAICNTKNTTITDCFARTGDDMFEVKTLGGVDTAISRNITFRRCQAWGSKARCFGVIGEIEKDVSDILFEDGIVIFRDATWDNNRIGSLVVLRECGTGNVDGVTFRNMSIHYDAGRPIQVGVYTSDLTGGTMQNIVFENVICNAKMQAQLRKNDGAAFTITLKNVSANGTAVNAGNVGEFFKCDANGMIVFD
ncbi:MAG: hypothetical protein IJ448_02545 [Oscillospiraceae bacterium]|nr:hypothetical protein [Oscillospiraceae bacterium]